MNTKRLPQIVGALVVFCVLLVSSVAYAAVVKNRLSQRLDIPLCNNRVVSVPAQGTAEIPQDQLSCAAVQRLIARRSLLIVRQ